MKAIAIHSTAQVPPASRLRQSLRLAAAALLSASLAVQPVLADPAADALARYQARHAHALTIEQELKQRVAALERQDAEASARSAQLQVRLGELIQQRQANDAAIGSMQAEMAGKEQLVGEARARMGQLEQQLRQVEAKIRENEGNKWTCYVPFAVFYCLFADLIGQRNALENQRRAFHVHLQAVERDRDAAQARLNQLQRQRGMVGAEQARVQAEADGVVQQLKVVHAELSRSRESYQSHRMSLDTFSAELKQVETLPPTDRAGVIERRLTRLDADLASQMGQACSLFTGGGAPLPEPVRQACALA